MADSKRLRAFSAVLAAGLLVAGIGAMAPAGAQQLQTLRGKVGLEDLNPAPDVTKQLIPADGMFDRAYRQQPPLVTHRMDGYQITKEQNQCLSCHDWPANLKAGAPKVSEAHFTDRDGNRLDRVSSARYFCPVCHVPQVDAKPLVSNTFKNAAEVK